MTQIPAGWYPDPSPAQPGQPPLVRYWDGAVWTEHVQAAAPAAPTPQPAPAYAPAPVVATGPTTPDGARLAGWWSRVGAYVIDSFALGILSQVLAIPGTIALQSDFEDVMDDWETRLETAQTWDEVQPFFEDLLGVFGDNIWWLLLPTLIASMLYFVGFWRWKGATPGQLVLGIKVRRRERDTGGLSLASGLPRWLVMGGVGSIGTLLAFSGGLTTFFVVSGVVAVFGVLNFLWPLWDGHRQALHDKVARTNVVKTRG